MPSLKDLKIRINSVTSTRKITKAMQMVAAAKLRRAHEAVEAARPFAERMNAVLGNLAAADKNSPTAPRLLAGTGKSDAHLLIVATAERGLCGGFNSSIVKLSRLKIDDLLRQGKTVKILTIGRKGREQLKRQYGEYFIGHVDHSGVKRLSYANAHVVGTDVLTRFDAGEFDVATVVFSRFRSVINQVPTVQQLIPAQFGDEVGTGAEALVSYEYEPSEEEILAELLPKNVGVQIFRALLENAASEQGARMAAMDNATRNASEMIDNLTLEYNRTRQAFITKELIEIISGAEAL